MAGCAANVVLLGDQMQLPAPQRAAHPSPLARASALEKTNVAGKHELQALLARATAAAGAGAGDAWLDVFEALEQTNQALTLRLERPGSHVRSVQVLSHEALITASSWHTMPTPKQMKM